jgi:hypothetical protein
VISAVSNSSELENMQANPLRADVAAASSDIRAACVPLLRAMIMPQILMTEW